MRIEGRRRDVFAVGVVGSPTGQRGDEGKPVNLQAHRVHRGRGRRTRVHDDGRDVFAAGDGFTD